MGMIFQYFIFIIVLCNFLFCFNELNYKIKYFGMYAADCKISKKDTIYNNIKSKKINFNIKSKSVVNYLFPVANNYSIIIGPKNNILFFKKNTSQPKVKNNLETEIIDNEIFYKNSNFIISNNYYNIFSLLYCLMDKTIPINNIFTLEREGLIFDASIEKKNDYEYKLFINERAGNKISPIIENTDMFTWAVFKKGSKRKIQLGKVSQ